MSDAAASSPRARQHVDYSAKGDWQDDVTGRTGRVQQQVDASANDTRRLRRAEGVGP